MQFSGYPKEFRYRVVKKALLKYDQGKVDKQQGAGQKKKMGKKGKNFKWYEDGDRFDSVVYVQNTVNGKLKTEVERIAKRLGLKIRVLEKSGTSVKGFLQKSEPFGKKLCGREGCASCERGLGLDCREHACVYSIKCKDCRERGVEKEYVGQTNRSIGERMDEHVKDIIGKKVDKSLGRHAVETHGVQSFQIDATIKAKCYGRPSRRLITESVMIEEIEDGNAMNSKSEWNYVDLKKVKVK